MTDSHDLVDLSWQMLHHLVMVEFRIDLIHQIEKFNIKISVALKKKVLIFMS